MSERLLFLDIDGVLNSCDTITESGPWRGERHHRLSMLCPEMCTRLAEMLAAEPDVCVVLSSTWRLMVDAVEMAALIAERVAPGLRPALAGRFIGRTGRTSLMGEARSRHGRGSEIWHWLKAHTASPDACHVAILDDDGDMGALRCVWVATSWLTGMLPRHVDHARGLLRAPLADVWGWEGWSVECTVAGGERIGGEP